MLLHFLSDNACFGLKFETNLPNRFVSVIVLGKREEYLKFRVLKSNDESGLEHIRTIRTG